MGMGPVKVTVLSMVFIVPLATLQKIFIERPVARLLSAKARGSECRVK